MGIVNPLRTAFSALALVVALLGVSIVPGYADQGRPGCTPAVKAAHSCCKTPTLKACCSDRSERSSQSAPAQSRVEVNPNFTAAAAIVIVDLVERVRAAASQHATPRAGPVDLPTLFSTLLI